MEDNEVFEGNDIGWEHGQGVRQELKSYYAATKLCWQIFIIGNCFFFFSIGQYTIIIFLEMHTNLPKWEEFGFFSLVF